MEHERGERLRGLRILLLLLSLIFVALLVYSPHIKYPFPFHIDEWRHITETYKMFEGKSIIENNFEFGFHLLLALISFLGDLVLIYKFLPAVAAVLAASALFLFVRQNFGFWSALASIFFLASLKSNTNILGLWFFVPLTACIPLLYLFFWIFTKAVEEKNKKFFFLSIPIFLLIIIIHPVSATFMLPVLAVFLLIDGLKKESFVRKHYALLLITAVCFFLVLIASSLIIRKNPLEMASLLISQLRFNYGWGVVEIFYNPITFYNIIPSLLALYGMFIAIKKKEWLFVIWPIITLIMLFCYRFFRVSFFAPYQRMFYYFLLSVVPLSGIGTVGLVNLRGKLKTEKKISKILEYSIVILVIVLLLMGTFFNYYKQGGILYDMEGRGVKLSLYNAIDEKDYRALLFLKNLPDGRVVAEPLLSETIYPITRHNTTGTLYFYGNRKFFEYFQPANCTLKERLIRDAGVSYVYSRSKIECGWSAVYDKDAYIYDVDSIRRAVYETSMPST